MQNVEFRKINAHYCNKRIRLSAQNLASYNFQSKIFKWLFFKDLIALEKVSANCARVVEQNYWKLQHSLRWEFFENDENLDIVCLFFYIEDYYLPIPERALSINFGIFSKE